MEKENKPTVKLNTPIDFKSLGRQIKISPRSLISINRAGLKIEFMTETVQVLIGIGRDHTAYLIMDKDAHEALLKDETVNITTAKEFRKGIK